MDQNEMNEILDELAEDEISLCENTEGASDEGTEAEDTVSQLDVESLREQKLMLEGEIANLKHELEKKREDIDRKAREYAEFRELFPNVDPDCLDPEVISSVESGIPITAAYALYEKRIAAKNAATAAHNKATKQGGFGSVGRNAEIEYFSPDEVRAMSRSEVRENYNKILRSMSNWH